MFIELMLDALAPTNFLPTNPAALKRAFDTGGASLVKGAQQFLDDLVNNEGRPRQVDASGFEVGRNLACTPGKVVYRNELMELIQYEPQTEQVHATPLLCSPPWINKYYVMDLAPGRSFIEWAVQARPHRVRDQLPQPVGGHVRHHHGRLPGARPEDRAGRDRGDHRRRTPSTSSGSAWAARSPRSPRPT